MKSLGAFLGTILLLAALAGCGGIKSSSNTTPSPTPGTAAPGQTGGAVNAPIVISLGAGQTATGVDISVPGPASSPAPNAQVLGVAPLGAGGSAANTGATIQRGDAAKVLLFGPGLSGDMQVTIAGPQDITITNVRSINSTTNVPGVAFDVVVSPTAAVGGRTVFLKNAQNDITAFAGGLEVR